MGFLALGIAALRTVKIINSLSKKGILKKKIHRWKYLRFTSLTKYASDNSFLIKTSNQSLVE